MTSTATITKVQATSVLSVLNVGERDVRKDPEQMNGTLSTLVCAGREFPARCYQGWTVRIGRREVRGSYGEIVAAIRAHVARVNPNAVA